MVDEKRVRDKEKLPERMSKLLRRAAFSKGEFKPHKELIGFAFSNVDKVRRDALNILFQELGRHLEHIADNYTIKVKAELNFERKKNKKKKS